MSFRPSSLDEADLSVSCADLETKASLKSKHSEMSEEEQVRHHICKMPCS